MIDNVRTGAYIAKLRQRAGMTQTQLAGMLNVTHQAVSKWENGSALPDMQTMLDLSALFAVTIEQILTAQEIDPAEKYERETVRTPEPEETAAPAPEMIDPVLEENMRRIERETERTAQQNGRESGPDMREDWSAENGRRPDFDWDHIASIAPFLGKEALGGMIERAGGEMHAWHLEQIAPFVSGRALGKLALGLAERGEEMELSSIAPFMGSDALGEVVEAQMRGHGIEWYAVESVAPFLRRAQLDRIVLALAENDRVGHIEHAAPFLSKDALGKAALIMQERGRLSPDSIASLAPFLPGEILKELVKGGRQERKNDADRGSAPFDMGVVREGLNIAREAMRIFGMRTHECSGHSGDGAPHKAEHVHRMIDEGNWDEVDLLFDRADPALRREILRRAAQEELWDFADRHLDRCSAETRREVMRMAIDAEAWPLVGKHFDRCNAETRAEIVRAAMDSENWDLLGNVFGRLGGRMRAEIAEYAAQGEEWDFVRERFDLLDPSVQSELLCIAAEAEYWPLVEAHIADADEDARGRIVGNALENGEKDILKRVFPDLSPAVRARIVRRWAREEEFCAVGDVFSMLEVPLRTEMIRAAARAECWDLVREFAPAEGDAVCLEAAIAALDADEEELLLELAGELSAQNMDVLTNSAIAKGKLDIAQKLTEASK